MQSCKPLFIFFLMSLVCVRSAQAETFDVYVQRLNEHPQVKSILAESEAFTAQAEGELGLPDPTLMVGVDNVPIADPAFNRFLPSSKVIGFTQAIPSWSGRQAKSRRFEQLSEKTRLLADYMNARLRFMLISRLAEYKSVQTQQQLLRKQLSYYRELENTLKGQIESGRSVYQRFSEIDVERAETERRINDLEARVSMIEADFIRLIGEVPNIEVPKTSATKWNQNPEVLYPIAIAAEDIDIAEENVGVAYAAFLPNWGVNASYKQREDGENGMFAGDDWFSVKVQMTVPLWAEKKQRPKLRAAKEQKRSAKLAYDDQVRIWQRKMKALQSSYEAAAKNLDVLQVKNKAIEKKIDAAQRNYEAGTDNLDSVLLARIDRLNIQAQLTAVQEMHTSLSAEITSNIISTNHEVSE